MAESDNSSSAMDGLSAADQEQLVALLDRYLIATEEGRSPDVESLVAEQPHLEKPLRQYLAGLNLIRQANPGHMGSVGSDDQRAGRLSEYELGAEIGRGAMGIVYAATEKGSGREVALKILAFGSSLDAGMIERFAREARAAQSLSHPNIVPVYDIGCDAAVHYYSMQRIEGDSLDRHIADARNRRRDAADSADGSLLSGNDRFRQIALRTAEIADALHQAHENGIVHRDVKPSNVLRDPTGKLWLTDFGLVRIHQEQSLTKTGDLVGTYRYMSPEQARGRVDLIGPHTDIYGLGATLYEMLALRPLFRGDDRARLLHRIDQQAPQPLRHWDPRIPKDLETIVLKAIHADHTQRYASAKHFAADLTRFATGERILARREKWRVAVGRRFRTHSRLASAIAGGLLLVLLIGTFINRWPSVADSGGTGNVDPAIRQQIGELQLAELARAEGPTEAIDAKYEQLIGLLSDHGDRLDQQRLLCRAQNQWAAACIKRGELETAEALLRQATELTQRLPAIQINNTVKGLTRVNLARLYVAQHDIPAAMESFAAAVPAWARQPEQVPAAASQLVGALNDLCMDLKAASRSDAAVEVARELNRVCDWETFRGDAALPQMRQVSIARNNLGALFYERDDFAASVAAYRDSISLFEQILEAYPWNDELRAQYAVTLNNLGRSQAAIEDSDAASHSFHQAIAIIDPLYQSDDTNADLAYQAGGIWNNLSVLQRGQNDLLAAEKSLENAQLRLQRAVELSPQALHFRKALDKIEQRLKSTVAPQR